MNKAPFRIAFRSEGPWVKCYLAEADTMRGAQLVSMMPRAMFEMDAKLFGEWREFIQRAMVPVCKSIMGVEPTDFIVESAPEHERSGRA